MAYTHSLVRIGVRGENRYDRISNEAPPFANRDDLCTVHNTFCPVPPRAAGEQEESRRFFAAPECSLELRRNLYFMAQRAPKTRGFDAARTRTRDTPRRQIPSCSPAD